ncbi:Alpha-1,4-N-acetylgalactosamine transferase PglH [Alkalibacterium sp. AK22]|uniref:glycosyltransferase n=1 Tax=Alkalibacterium sp. AK22 TaxID=1229520 RepID=UPI00044AC021|nr:glycosyltransferase [Alkalibacterium sp. AK22]EXJ23320.1 Alpha-1,4-N-acetylgalactosamine transferase PglH [Alkalibacterium sp. AK22]
MKILFVAENLTYGGAPRRFVELANEMSNRGAQVSILLLSGYNRLKNVIDKDIEIIEKSSSITTSNWFKRNVFQRLKKIKIIRNELNISDYDIVISFNDMTNIDVLLLKYVKKFNIIISERSDPYYNNWYLKFLKKILFKKANGVVFQTEGARDFFDSKVKKNSTIIPNPISSKNQFNRYDVQTKKIIVNVARFWLYQKRQDILLKAFKEFNKKYPSYKLVLFGDGPDENKIKKIIIELGLENHVILAGVSDNLIEEIKIAEIFVLTSDFEGMPNALIEAMAVGLPVVSTDCSPGGSRYLINNNLNGLLVDRGNHIEVCNAMLKIADNPDFAQHIGNNARKILDTLNEEKINNTWYEFLKSSVK